VAPHKPAPGPDEIRKNWPGFRGPFGLGVAFDASPPLDWDGPSGRNVRWKTEVPLPGFSSPAVWGSFLFLTGGEPRARELFCFDVGTGMLIWRRNVESPPGMKPPDVTEDTGYAAPSPATDGRAVCALFASGDLACFDVEGNALWKRNLGVPVNPYGHGSSLLVWGDLLVVQYDHGGSADVRAYRLLTGEPAWRTERIVEVSWSSPALVDAARRPTLLLNGNPFVAAYEASSGLERWRVECMMGEVASSPAFLDGIVFVANENALLAAIEMDTQEIQWEADLDLPDVSSPVASGGRLWVPSSGGAVTCYDARTGDEIWLHEFEEGFWASPILAARRIYLLDKKGVMRIFADKAEYEDLGSPALGESSMCTPAFVGKRLYVRGSRFLFCIGEEDD